LTTRIEYRFAAAAVAILLVVGPSETAGQSAGQLGAWDGLMLSPAGALAPVARDPTDWASGVNEFSVRYGRWRYDADDAVHDNFGLTWTHSLGFARAQVAITGAYELVECPTCFGWQLAGIDLQSTLWTHDFPRASGRPVSAGVRLRVSLGGARYLGSEATTTTSAAVAVPIDIALPFAKTSSLCASIVPGFGFGRIAGPDEVESGLLPMIGGAVAWTITSRFGVDLGVQRIFISGGPTEIGAAFSWKLGSIRSVRP
jgi:hypothetical protein